MLHFSLINLITAWHWLPGLMTECLIYSGVILSMYVIFIGKSKRYGRNQSSKADSDMYFV